MNDYKVSILVPTYNRSFLLKDCLNSISNQTYQNIELIIINDCSKDNTDDVVSKYKNLNIKYIKNKQNLGSKFGDQAHFKKFFEIMTGDFFIYITDDDYWPDTNFLNRCVQIFIKYPTLASVIGGQISEFYDNERELRTYNHEKIKLISENPDEKTSNFYFHKNLFNTGFMSGHEYLDVFSKNATSHNLSVTGTMRKKKIHSNIGYMEYEKSSKWQGGYQNHLPGAIYGDIFYINEPCVVARINKNNASFRLTQYEHYIDSVLSIENAFSFLKKEVNKTKIIKYKKNFIVSLSNAYMHNTKVILSGKKLTLTSKENNSRYVDVIDILKIYLKFKIFPKFSDLKNFFIIIVLQILNKLKIPFYKKIISLYLKNK